MNKHKWSPMLALAVGLGLTLTLLSLLGRAHAATGVRYVAPAPGGTDAANTCTDKFTPCATIQHAVDEANAGDSILVAAGSYSDVQGRLYPNGYFSPPPGGIITQVIYINKSLTVRGGYDANFDTWDPATLTTTLDAQGAGRVIMIAGNITVAIDSLHITGGDASGLSGGAGANDTGGGVYALHPTLTLGNCQVHANTAYYGGGVALLYANNAMLQDNVIRSNAARGEISRGGGVYLKNNDSATLEGNTIFSNSNENYGGGVYLENDVNTTFSHNDLERNTSLNGGGVFLNKGHNITLNGNTFYSNTATTRGGGIYVYSSTAALDNNAIIANQDGGYGNGVYIGASTVYLRHNTLTRNYGGNGSGVYAATITMDPVSVPSYVTMTNTILTSHTIGVNVLSGSAITLNGVLWSGNGSNTQAYGLISIANSISGDPAFASDGYHITPASAAVDAGVEAGLATDIDGDLRISGDGPDLGADDFPFYLAPGRVASIPPGGQAVYTHTLANHASVTQTFGFATDSSQGWQVDIYAAGYASGTLGSSLLLPYALAPGQTGLITATVQVPGDALGDTLDTTLITATGSLVGQDTLLNATTVLPYEAAPSLEPDRNGSAASGQWAVYTHTLTNHASSALAFELTAASLSGMLFNIVPTTTAALAPWDGSTVITVAIKASSGPENDTLDTTVITATAQAQPSLWATATDTTLMSPAHIYLPLLIR